MLLFAAILVWGVRHPFSYRNLKVTGRIRYAHVICVTLAVLIPLLASLVTLTEGYRINDDSPYVCSVGSLEFAYYSLIFPISILQAVTTFMLVVIFWTIFKEFVLKKLLLRKKTVNVVRGQLKISILIVYSTIHTVLGTLVAVYLDQSPEIRSNFKNYIICERMGTESDCVLDNSSQLVVSNTFTTARVMLNLIPVVILLTSCGLKCCCKCTKERKATAAHAMAQVLKVM